MKSPISQKGFGLIEIMIGAALITVAIVALLASYNVYLSYAFSNQFNVRAGLLLEEGVEISKLLRDDSWTSYVAPLSAGVTYYFSFNGTKWQTTTTPEPYVDSVFARSFTVSPVSRDANNDIVTSGGTVDAGTKKVTISVSYRAGKSTTTQTVSTYITNLHTN